MFSLFFIFKYTYKQNYEILSVTRTYTGTHSYPMFFGVKLFLHMCELLISYFFFFLILFALITPLVSTHISALIGTSVLTFLQHYSDFSQKETSYRRCCGVYTSESRSLRRGDVSHIKTSTVTIFIRPGSGKQCRGSTSILGQYNYAGNCTAAVFQSDGRADMQSHTPTHTPTLEPSLGYIKTINQRNKQKILTNILKATREIILNHSYVEMYIY